MKLLLPKIAAAALFAVSGLASASASLADCSLTDIYFDIPGVTVSKCYGFVAGNMINSSPADTLAVKNILSTQFAFPGQSGAPIESINVVMNSSTHVTTYDFAHLLTGDVIVGLHFGRQDGNNLARNGFLTVQLISPKSGPKARLSLTWQQRRCYWTSPTHKKPTHGFGPVSAPCLAPAFGWQNHC